jgi:acyl carrier protein
MNIESRVQGIFARHFGFDPFLTPERNLRAFDLDSMDSIWLAMAIEDEFSISLSEAESTEIVSASSAVALVKRVLARMAPSDHQPPEFPATLAHC